MAKTKYGKYILRPTGGNNTNLKSSAIRPVILEGPKDWGGIQHRMKWSFILQPTVIEDKPHSHDFDEFLCFYSCNPANPVDFAAEIELILGQEGERQIIQNPTVVCLPKGLLHGPLSFKEVTKPVLFCRIYTAPEYVSQPA